MIAAATPNTAAAVKIETPLRTRFRAIVVMAFVLPACVFDSRTFAARCTIEQAPPRRLLLTFTVTVLNWSDKALFPAAHRERLLPTAGLAVFQFELLGITSSRTAMPSSSRLGAG